jgi:hypothetical protein
MGPHCGRREGSYCPSNAVHPLHRAVAPDGRAWDGLMPIGLQRGASSWVSERIERRPW